MKKKGKKAKPGNRKKQAPKKQTNNNKKRRVSAAKVFVYTLALGALGGAVYLTRDYLKRRKNNSSAQFLPSGSSDKIIINNNLPASYTSLTTATRSTATTSTDSFPLKRGSRGARVFQLQQALAGILGASVMNANGGIDGIFGSGTANALKLAGYSEVVDEATFNKIISKAGLTVQVVFNPKELADSLYRFAQGKNLDGVLSILKQMKSPSDYSSVNEYYKRIGFISKTIVTDLLDYAFKSDEQAKQQIRNEFFRMGLKADTTGRWSLYGLNPYKDLITLRDTVVVDSFNHRIVVPRNTILGDELEVANGMTWFRSVDNTILKVPTRDVKYTN